MAANLPTFLEDTTNQRNSEYTGTPFDSDGGNLAGSCAPGIGINTGNFDPKASDWPRIEDTVAQTSQQIGQAATAITVDQDPDFNDTTAFVQADGSTAPDAVLDVTTGAVNKTGQTVPANSWAWGVIPVA